MSKIKITYCLIVCFAGAMMGNTAMGQTQEQIVKTVYLVKFANYIEWPKSKASNDNVFRIVVVGDAELCKVVEEGFHQRRVKGQEVEVVCSKKIDALSNIDMYILTSNKAKDLEVAMDLCAKQNFLLVTESRGFANQGAHINFYITEEQTLHFEMNKRSLDYNGFEVDFLLLEFAKVVVN